MDIKLVRKYNVSGPRYTSYPPVPSWTNEGTIDTWKAHVQKTFKHTNSTEGISIYIHLPYCESLCTFCGCNTRITVNHNVEEPYLNTVLKEWQLYLALFDEKPFVREIHLGGGTPTFFSPEHLKQLVQGILDTVEVADEYSFGFEGHPKNTNREHLQTLYNLGFKRVSFGIQDFDPVVQKTINREQSYESVETVTNIAREIGYTSINYDLVYGLPKQTKDSVIDTINKVNILRPDRIALYSYAHVPWIKPGQRGFTEADLPTDENKRELYEISKQMLGDNGYMEFGMDHFALEHDSLAVSFHQKNMHRNFMGYSDLHTSLMVGLGVSSIGDSWTAYGQNLKVVEPYLEAVNNNEFPLLKSSILSENDLVMRRHILNLMCQFETTFTSEEMDMDFIKEGFNKLTPLIEDGLVEIKGATVDVPEKGRPFVRNICMCFDEYLWKQDKSVPVYSSTV